MKNLFIAFAVFLSLITSSCFESSRTSKLSNDELTIIGSRWCFPFFKRTINLAIDYTVATKRLSYKDIPEEVLYPLGVDLHKKAISYYQAMYSDSTTDNSDDYSIFYVSRRNSDKWFPKKNIEEKKKIRDDYYVSLADNFSEYKECVEIGIDVYDSCADENSGLDETKHSRFVIDCFREHPNSEGISNTANLFSQRVFPKINKLRSVYFELSSPVKIRKSK